MRSSIVVLIACSLMTSPLGAQDFSGTYTTPNQAGGVVTLTILQTAAGQVSGSLASPGVSFALNGLVQEASVLGTLSGDMGGVYFAAELTQGGLQVTLIEPGPDNQPNYDSAQTMMFTRAGPAAAAPPVGGQPTPTGGPLGSVGAAPSPPVQGGGGATRLDGWNISYQVPGGWNRGQDVGRMAVYGHMSEAGMLSVTPGLYRDFNEVVADVGAAFQAMGMAAQPIEGPSQTTIAGMQAVAAVLVSQDQMGRPVHTRVVGVLTGHGTGLIVSGMTTPQQMAQLRQVVDRVSATISAQAPTTNQQAVAALAGRWMYYDGAATGVTRPGGGSSRSVEQYVTFDGAGGFQFQSSASVSVTGGIGGMAGGASSSSDQGTYTVIGSTLVVKGQQGQQAFQLQILGDRIVADGRTYLRAN